MRKPLTYEQRQRKNFMAYLNRHPFEKLQCQMEGLKRAGEFLEKKIKEEKQ
jgi:hypothetical protein